MPMALDETLTSLQYVCARATRRTIGSLSVCNRLTTGLLMGWSQPWVGWSRSQRPMTRSACAVASLSRQTRRGSIGQRVWRRFRINLSFPPPLVAGKERFNSQRQRRDKRAQTIPSCARSPTNPISSEFGLAGLAHRRMSLRCIDSHVDGKSRAYFPVDFCDKRIVSCRRECQPIEREGKSYTERISRYGIGRTADRHRTT